MVSPALQEMVDALGAEDRLSLIEYLMLTTDPTDEAITLAQIDVLARRDAELEADPSIGVTRDEFMARLRAEWT
jgi:putative addiction module component (TIGR02574 family)